MDAYAFLAQDVGAYATRADGRFCECYTTSHMTRKQKTEDEPLRLWSSFGFFSNEFSDSGCLLDQHHADVLQANPNNNMAAMYASVDAGSSIGLPEWEHEFLQGLRGNVTAMDT
jgi:hypothetical protein